MKRIWLTTILMFATMGIAVGQQTTTSFTTSDPDGTAWANGTYSIQYVNQTPGKPYNTSTGQFITTLYTGTLNSSGALSLTLDDVKYVNPANGTWAFTICPNVSGGNSNCSTVDIPVTGTTENVSSLVNAALRAPRPGGGVGAYGYADVEFQSIPGNTYVVSPALTVQRCYAGSWAACGSGGGSSLPTAPTGSIITNTNGSTTYAGQANIIYQQSGDTIASIETACSSPCTYVVTSPQTITLAASHAMNSNVWLRFEADGKWTVNGSTYVLSNVQVAPGTTTTTHFPAGTGSLTLSTLNTLVPVEWFGAVAGGSASTNLTAIQATINALTIGQPYLSGNYPIAGTLTINQSSVCLAGPPAGRGGYVGGLTETVAGDDALDIHGTSTTYVDFGVCENFFISSSVGQTGTVAGLSASFTGGLTVRNVVSSDFFYPFYIHASPSYQSGGFYNDQASWSTLSSAMTSPVGFYLDSADGNPESSLILEHNGVSAPATGGPSQPWGLVASGQAIEDWLSTDLNVASVNGVQLNYTGSGTSIGCSDIHLVDTTIDNFLTYGMQIENLSGNCTPSWEVSGGWIYVGPNTAVTGSYLMDIENSSNGTISHTLQGAHSGAAQSLHGDYVNGASSTNVVFTGNSYYNQGNAIDFNGSNGNAATGNSDADNANIDFSATNGATYNSFVGNQMTGLGSGANGIYIPIGNNYNPYVGNTCNSAATATCINDGGTGNGLSAPITFSGSSTGAFNILTLQAPNSANGTTVSSLFGHDQSTNNMSYWQWHYVSTGSTNNHLGLTFYGLSGDTYDAWPNGSVTVGETTSAAGPANGIAVGTTGQFQVSGAGAVTAPSVTTTLLATKQQGQTYYADQFSGADASVKINACITAVIAANGGTCDARALGGTTPQTLSETILVGSHALISTNEMVTLLLPNVAVWNWALTDGTSCGIEQFSNTALIGDQTGGAWAGMTLGAASSSTHMDSLYCTDPSPVASTGSNVRAEGFFANNTTGAGTFAHGLLDIQHLADNSHFTRITALNPTGDAAWIQNVCCGVTLENIELLSGIPGGSTSGGTPLTITGQNTDLVIKDSTFDGPGTGHYNVYIDPTTNSYGLDFENIYTEKYSTDYSTPEVYIGADAVNTIFHGGLMTNSCASSCAQYAIENHSTNGISVKNVGYGYYSTDGIDDIANSITVPTDGYTINNYATVYNNSGNFSFQRLQTQSLSGFGPSPTLAVTTGTASLSTGSTNLAGVVNSTTSGTLSFSFMWANGGAAGNYAHRAVCSFSDETTPTDVIHTTGTSTPYQTFATGTTVSGDVISYLCAGY